MTFDEYKAVLDKIHADTHFHSNPRMWTEHALFQSLVDDENARMHVYELLMDHPSWVVISLVRRVYPEIPFCDEYAGLYDKLVNYFLTWIEDNA